MGFVQSYQRIIGAFETGEAVRGAAMVDLAPSSADTPADSMPLGRKIQKDEAVTVFTRDHVTTVQVNSKVIELDPETGAPALLSQLVAYPTTPKSLLLLSVMEWEDAKRQQQRARTACALPVERLSELDDSWMAHHDETPGNHRGNPLGLGLRHVVGLEINDYSAQSTLNALNLISDVGRALPALGYLARMSSLGVGEMNRLPQSQIEFVNQVDWIVGQPPGTDTQGRL